MVERDQTSTHYVVDTYVSSLEQETATDPAQIVKDHIAAFNAHNLDGLLACFTTDATWTTGTDHFRGTAELARLFSGAFSEPSPELSVTTMLVDGDLVACELREHLLVGGMRRVDQIAGFYRVEHGRIAAAKIYREGSAGL